MSARVELSEEEAREVAQAILQSELARDGFERAEVRSGEDHDGDAALFVTAIIQEGRDILPPNAVSRAHAALYDGLLSRGDRRFPYLRFRWIGDEPFDDSSTVPA